MIIKNENRILSIIEVFLLTTTVLFAILWIRNPQGNYEPWTFFFVTLSAILELVRRKKVNPFIGLFLFLLAGFVVVWLCFTTPQMTRLNLDDFKSNMTNNMNSITNPIIISQQPIEFKWQAGKLAFSLYRVGDGSIFNDSLGVSPFKLPHLEPDKYLLKTNLKGVILEIYFDVVKDP